MGFHGSLRLSSSLTSRKETIMEMEFTSSIRVATAFALKVVGGQIDGASGAKIPGFNFFSHIQSDDLKTAWESRYRRSASRTVSFFCDGVLVVAVLVVATGHTRRNWRAVQFRYKMSNGFVSDAIPTR